MGHAKRGGRTTSRCHENQGKKYKYEHERAAAGIDDDGRSAQRPVAQKHNNKPYSGVTWRLGPGVTAAEVKTSHHRATRGTFRRLLSTTSPSGSVDWGRAKKHEEGENAAECRTGSRGREHSAAGEERSGRGGRYYLRNGRRVDGHDEGGGWYRRT